jgi:hypothetical protein
MAMLALLIPCAAQAQSPSRSMKVGVHAAFDVSDGRVEEERVGVQVHLPITGSVEFVPQFSYFLSLPGWRANFTARVRPRALGSLFTIGSGVSISQFDFGCAVPGCDASTAEVIALAVIGLDVPQWSLGPFGELHLLDILGGNVSATVMLGVKARL